MRLCGNNNFIFLCMDVIAFLFSCYCFNVMINVFFSVYRTWDIMLDWNDLSFPDYSFNLTLPTLCITHNLSTLPSSTVDVLDVSHKLHVVRPHWNILLSGACYVDIANIMHSIF